MQEQNTRLWSKGGFQSPQQVADTYNAIGTIAIEIIKIRNKTAQLAQLHQEFEAERLADQWALINQETLGE